MIFRRAFIAHSRGRGSLHLAGRAAPLLGIDVGDGLGKRPAVAGEVLDAVLPFPERVVGGYSQHTGAAFFGALVMAVDVFDAHHHAVREIDSARRCALWAPRVAAVPRGLLGHRHRAVADVELCAVVRDSQAQREPEGIAEPVNGLADVRIRELWNHRAARYGTVCKHFLPLSWSSLVSRRARLLTPYLSHCAFVTQLVRRARDIGSSLHSRDSTGRRAHDSVRVCTPSSPHAQLRAWGMNMGFIDPS